MDKWKEFFQTTEGWASLFAAILGVFVAKGLLSPELAKLAEQAILALIAIMAARVAKKAATPGEMPFRRIGGQS